MNASDPREELAAIARDLRKMLEREHAAGHGELLAQAAARARGAPSDASGVIGALGAHGWAADERGGEQTATLRGDRTGTPGGAPSAPLAAAARAGSAPAAIPLSLFDEATEPGAGHAPYAGAVAPPSFAEPLNPAGLEARAAIAAEAEGLLAAIAAEVEACQKCALWESRNKAVPGVGTARAGIVFIGEGPGAEEDRLGEPFVGRAGLLLDQILKAMNDARLIPGVPLNRQTVFIGNVIHCRPPENRMPLPIEVEYSSPYLLRQIAAIKPRIICCLGKTSAELLLRTKAALGALRGKVYRYRGAKLIVTYHPAACLRNPGYKRPVWEDMQLLAREYLSD